MLTCMWIFEIVLLCLGPGRWRTLAEPTNMTTCEEFELRARFNPYEVIDTMWKIFYFWGNHADLYPIVFSFPAKKRLLKVREIMESIEPGLEVEWDKATLFMNPRPDTEVLLLYAGKPGAFRALVIKEQRQKKVRPYPEPHIKFADVRMKMEGNYVGMMGCEDLSAFALARLGNLPVTETHCEHAAAKLGFHGPGGKSYLYLQKLLKSEL